jgi:hypothetical protein
MGNIDRMTLEIARHTFATGGLREIVRQFTPGIA